MLKEYQVRLAEETVCLAEEDEVDEEIPSWNDKVQGSMKIGEKTKRQSEGGAEVTSSKVYADIFRGKTHLVEHRIKLIQ